VVLAGRGLGFMTGNGRDQLALEFGPLEATGFVERERQRYCPPPPTAFCSSKLAKGFVGMMMAGLDGIANKIDPGPAMDKDLYDLPAEEVKDIPTVCSSLAQALEALDADREFLKAGGVFDDDLIDGYIELKMEEVTRFRMSTHPVEFDMYYSI
jgi:glutamine synthetase